MNPSRQRHAFSLIELLVVIAILATLAGMMSYNFARPEVRRQAVRNAAEELAATFRKARTMAMARKSTHAVVFHIQNQVGSDGNVLNNRSGGHQYRILGPAPRTQNQQAGAGTVDSLSTVGCNLLVTSELIGRSWVEEPHILSPGKVRFLALTDMDWGDRNPANISYPRPWFGWYDTNSRRLYPWGGYDRLIAGSGFYYWGTSKVSGSYATATADPEPVRSLNPVGRVLDHWSITSNFSNSSPPNPEAPDSDTLYKAQSPRALINADWRDCSIVFLATGEVRWGGWMPFRHSSVLRDAVTSGTPSFAVQRGVFDRTNGDSGANTIARQHFAHEASNFDQDSGGWFITLSPDLEVDTDRFDTARDALNSISPMYRVFISRIGEVKIIAVSRIPKFNVLSAWPPTAAWWQTASNRSSYFPADRIMSAGAVVSGSKPITDFVTQDMLSGRQVWMQ